MHFFRRAKCALDLVFSKPAMVFKRVDFPDPEGPTRATRLPGSTSKLTRLRAINFPKVLEISSITRFIFFF